MTPQPSTLGRRDFPIADHLTPPWDDAGPRITGVRAIVTAPDGVNLVVVRVETDVAGLIGWGCATFAHRSAAVAGVVDDYLGPRVIGRRAGDVTDIFHTLRNGPYWRDGPIDNNALAGIDMALWDIKGKVAGLPIWSLWGGRARAALPTYTTAYAPDLKSLVAQLAPRIAHGDKRFRVIITGGEPPGRRLPDPSTMIRQTADLLAGLRRELPAEAEFIVDVHGQLPPADAGRMASAVEPFHLLYLEDPLAVEDLGWLPQLRSHCRTPIALGEVFTSVNQYLPLIEGRQIDFVRCHVSAIGGLTPALRLQAAAELFGIRTAWHGPADMSPIGHAANVALGAAAPNFGVHEHSQPSEITRELFAGAPVMLNGFVQLSSRPGLGVDFDETGASRHPAVPTDRLSGLEGMRRSDGTAQRP